MAVQNSGSSCRSTSSAAGIGEKERGEAMVHYGVRSDTIVHHSPPPWQAIVFPPFSYLCVLSRAFEARARVADYSLTTAEVPNSPIPGAMYFLPGRTTGNRPLSKMPLIFAAAFAAVSDV